MRFPERLPFDCPRYSGFWTIDASRGRPVLWLNARLGWGHAVHLEARKRFASHRYWASCLFE